MKAVIRNLNSKVIDGNMSSITIPGVNGEIEILPGHAKAFFLLQKGRIKAKSTSGRVKNIDVQEGICWVDEIVTVLFSPELKGGND